MGDAPYGTDPIPYPLPNNGDNIHIITQQGRNLGEGCRTGLGPKSHAAGIAEGHPSGNGLPVLNGTFASVNAAVFVAPCAAGVAISNDGNVLVVANYYNDSITVFTGGLSSWLGQWQARSAYRRKKEKELCKERNSICAPARPSPRRRRACPRRWRARRAANIRLGWWWQAA